jgi:hypothetical protein
MMSVILKAPWNESAMRMSLMDGMRMVSYDYNGWTRLYKALNTSSSISGMRTKAGCKALQETCFE